MLLSAPPLRRSGYHHKLDLNKKPQTVAWLFAASSFFDLFSVYPTEKDKGYTEKRPNFRQKLFKNFLSNEEIYYRLYIKRKLFVKTLYLVHFCICIRGPPAFH